MAIYRVHKTKKYTVMSNYHLKDERLSLKAKGLLSVFLSLPDDWDYSVEGIVAICREEKTAVRKALTELKDNGYLVISRTHGEHGKFEFNYDIYELPKESCSPCIGFPYTVKPYTDNPSTVNQPQLNNNILNNNKLNNNKLNNNKLNTKELNTKELKEKDSKESKKKSTHFQKPTAEEISQYCQEKHIKVDAERFIDFYASKGWKVGRELMVDWKAAVRGWARRDADRKTEKPKPNKFHNFDNTNDAKDIANKLMQKQLARRSTTNEQT